VGDALHIEPGVQEESRRPREDGGRIALAVVTRDRAHLLARCLLPALEDVAAASGVDVLVVDQSEGPETERLIEDLHGVRYVRSTPGLSRGRNIAVAATAAPLVAFTDDDVTIPPGWLDGIVHLFESEPRAGAVCGRAFNSRGELLPGPAPGVYRWPTNPFGLGNGFNFSFRRAALEEVGEFDEQLGPGAPFRNCEDTDMLYRILGAGWAVVCSDDITVVHHDWRTRVETVRLLYNYGFGIGAQTAKQSARADRWALRFGLEQAGRNIRAFARWAVTLHPVAAASQLAALVGIARGFVAWRRAAA
jgi:GT2 family glycosyltransferase